MALRIGISLNRHYSEVHNPRGGNKYTLLHRHKISCSVKHAQGQVHRSPSRLHLLFRALYSFVTRNLVMWKLSIHAKFGTPFSRRYWATAVESMWCTRKAMSTNETTGWTTRSISRPSRSRNIVWIPRLSGHGGNRLSDPISFGWLPFTLVALPFLPNPC